MNDVPGVSNGGAPSQWTAYKLLKDPQIKNGDVWGDRNCYILDGQEIDSVWPSKIKLYTGNQYHMYRIEYIGTMDIIMIRRDSTCIRFSPLEILESLGSALKLQ